MNEDAKAIADALQNKDGEVVVPVANGCTLRSGSTSSDFVSGEYVRLCDPDGNELLYWDNEEWKEDPVLVMGAIINSAAGLRVDLQA